jgi:uncharacterized membrane protein HdeD (DUF308 family)
MTIGDPLGRGSLFTPPTQHQVPCTEGRNSDSLKLRPSLLNGHPQSGEGWLSYERVNDTAAGYQTKEATMATVLEGGLKHISRVSLVLSIVLIIFGVLAITLPMATSVGVVMIIGWLVIFDGLAQLVHAAQSKGIGHIIWKILVALLYLVAGAYLLTHPTLGVAGFTLVLAIFLFAEGVTDVVAYFSTRKAGGKSLWMLVDGIITLVLGFMIWNQWPVGSLWVIGTLVGISMVMTGITRLMMTLAIRSLARNLAANPSNLG